MAAENAQIEKGDTVAVWGCGPVAQFAIQSAWMFGAGRVIAIDRVPERLALAKRRGKAETINFDDGHVYDRLQEMTKGRGRRSVTACAPHVVTRHASRVTCSGAARTGSRARGGRRRFVTRSTARRREAAGASRP